MTNINTFQGKVGVGTNTPGLPLETYTGNGANYGLRLRRGAGAAFTDLGHLSTPGTEGLAFNVSDGSSTTQEVMRITGTGNVGVGTNAPKQAFEVGSSDYGLFSGRLGVGNVLTSAQNGGGQDVWNLGTSAKLLVRNATNANVSKTYANARAHACIALVPGFDTSDTTNMGLWGGGSGENPTFYIQNQVNNGANGGGLIALQPVAGSVVIGHNAASSGTTLDVATQHGEISTPIVHFRTNRDSNSNGDGNVLRLESGGNRNDVEILECVAPSGTKFVTRADGKVGIGNPVVSGGPYFTLDVSNVDNANPGITARFVGGGGPGIRFVTGLGGTSNNWKSTGIGLSGTSGGGAVFFVFTMNNSGTDNSGAVFYFIRKPYDQAYWANSAFKVMGSNGGGSSENVSFRNSGGTLQYRASSGGNGVFYAIEFDA